MKNESFEKYILFDTYSAQHCAKTVRSLHSYGYDITTFNCSTSAPPSFTLFCLGNFVESHKVLKSS